jgi:lysozyme
MKALILSILKFISALVATQTPPVATQTPPGRNEKDQPVQVERINDIKWWEALRTRAYRPTPHDVWTIGYGHTSTAHEGMVITEAEAERLLRQDLAWVREAIAKHVEVPLSQEQYDALASFIFNVGEGNFASSTLLRKLNAYDYVGAADEFPRWNKQRQDGRMVALLGLTRRRAHERELFLEGTSA